MNRFKMINTFYTIVLIAIILTSVAVSCIRFNKDRVIVQKDTVYVSVTDSSLVTQLDSLCNVIDSLEQENEFIFDELSVAIFKLERIRDYNEVAKKGNNIKFLRGWINRVLNE